MESRFDFPENVTLPRPSASLPLRFVAAVTAGYSLRKRDFLISHPRSHIQSHCVMVLEPTSTSSWSTVSHAPPPNGTSPRGDSQDLRLSYVFPVIARRRLPPFTKASRSPATIMRFLHRAENYEHLRARAFTRDPFIGFFSSPCERIGRSEIPDSRVRTRKTARVLYHRFIRVFYIISIDNVFSEQCSL